MRVCIIGAGLSGLSCAIALERYGIIPDVFELSERSGGRVPFTAALLQLAHRPAPDPLLDLRKRYGISIAPIHTLDKLVMFSPRNVAAARGWLGYIVIRGAHPRSVESQLYAQLSATKIRFNTMGDYRELSALYDRVVVATGTTRIAKEMGCWSDIFRNWARTAVIEGQFEPGTWLSWYNKSYANNGYGFLGPFSSTEASLGLIVSDIGEGDLESKWRMFLDTEKINYREKQNYVLEHITGVCYPMEVGNITFVGNAAGLMDSLVGFGIYNAIVSGFLAAESIYEQSSYEQKISFLKERMYSGYVGRLALNKFKNDDYDHLLGVLKTPPINNLIYNTNLNVWAGQGKLLELKGRPGLFDKFHA
ncbi:MAG TPA: NAD(P)-binding protein [Spirochaetia bacterium]|nr:NAD(P)-binding protein [Spirochaetia bacterium]